MKKVQIGNHKEREAMLEQTKEWFKKERESSGRREFKHLTKEDWLRLANSGHPTIKEIEAFRQIFERTDWQDYLSFMRTQVVPSEWNEMVEAVEKMRPGTKAPTIELRDASTVEVREVKSTNKFPGEDEHGRYNIFTYHIGRKMTPDPEREDLRAIHFYYFDTVVPKAYMRMKTYHQMFVEGIDMALKKKDVWAKWLFDKYLVDTHRFMFTKGLEESDAGVLDEEKGKVDPLDLPYPCVHFEIIGQSMMRLKSKSDDNSDTQILSIVAKEIAPKMYSFLLLAKTEGSMLTVIEIKDSHHEMWKVANGLLRIFLERLAKEKAGVEKLKPHRVTLGGGSGYKKTYTPRPIVYVRNKKEKEESVRAVSGNEIEWTHQWEVRGTWVTFWLDDEKTIVDTSRIGKDRDGDYNVIGYTWRVHHVKGPKDKPLIKKSYIVEVDREFET